MTGSAPESSPEEATTPLPGHPREPSPLRAKWERAWRWVLRLAPWVSLGFSATGAVWMERDASHAAEVALAVAGSWLAMSALLWLRRRQLDADHLLFKAADFAGIAAAQSLAQLPLFFTAPFFALAFAWTLPQALFLLLFLAVLVVVSWDPLAERLLPDRWVGPPLLAFGGFVGLRVALSMLGLSTLWALLASLPCVALGLVWDLRLRWPDTVALQRWTMAAAVTLVLALLSVAMPAAPLHLVDAGLGTDVQSRVLQGRSSQFAEGSRLWCWTAVFAPRESHDVLLHRWSRNGQLVAELALPVEGGRREGFRTWSRLRAHRAGEYECEVRTRVGQVLGRVSAQVGH